MLQLAAMAAYDAIGDRDREAPLGCRYDIGDAADVDLGAVDRVAAASLVTYAFRAAPTCAALDANR